MPGTIQPDKKPFSDYLPAPPRATWGFLSKPQQSILDTLLNKANLRVRSVWGDKGKRLGHEPPKNLPELLKRIQGWVGMVAHEHRTAWEKVLPGMAAISETDYELWKEHQAMYRLWLGNATMLRIAPFMHWRLSGGKAKAEMPLVVHWLKPRHLRPFKDKFIFARDPWQVVFVEPVAIALASVRTSEKREGPDVQLGPASLGAKNECNGTRTMGKGKTKTKAKRKYRPRTEPTPKQRAAWVAVKQEGSLRAAARKLGMKSHTGVKKLYDKAEALINQSGRSVQARSLPTDKRGQAIISG